MLNQKAKYEDSGEGGDVCLPLAPGVLSFATVCSFGVAYQLACFACTVMGVSGVLIFSNPLFLVICAVHCCTLLSVCLCYASANRGGMSGEYSRRESLVRDFPPDIVLSIE